MRLLELELKNFGKFHNEKIELSDGIQVIYGENESGKSTIHTFISSMLFGMERGRGRAAGKDTFSKYEPWENGNYYSGVLRMESEGKVFRLERNFDKYAKSAQLICETDGERLSVEDGDLTMLLGGLDAGVYANTLCIGQLHAVTGQELSDALQNYATNYYVTGDSDVDYTAAMGYLLAKKKEVQKQSKELLVKKQKEREDVAHESSYVWRDLHHLETELGEIEKELSHRKEEKKLEAKEVEWRKKRVTDELRPANWRIHPVEIITIIAMVLGSFVAVPDPWNNYVSIILALACGIYVWNRMKIGKSRQKSEAEEILEQITPEEELISTEKLLWEQEDKKKQYQEKQVEYENLQEHLQELDEIGEEYAELDRKESALTLAMLRLEESSQEMQKQLANRLNQRVSDILSEITGGKYARVTVDSHLKLQIFHGGKLLTPEQVSRGTLEQIYFALRMAAAEIMNEEEYPVILDDTFAYYDETRLRQTLHWLAKSGKQVLLFTCHKREADILKETGEGDKYIRI